MADVAVVVKESVLGPVVIVLAAGQGRRFVQSGGMCSKLGAMLRGQSVLAHVLDAVQASGLQHHVVDAQQGGPGMADSIAAGVRATPDASAWLVLPGDLPLLQAATIQQLAQALVDAAPSGIRAVMPRQGNSFPILHREGKIIEQDARAVLHAQILNGQNHVPNE